MFDASYQRSDLKNVPYLAVQMSEENSENFVTLKPKSWLTELGLLAKRNFLNNLRLP
jgi:hypothetical protein